MPQAKMFPVGGSGQAWRDGARGAFSAGSYYVEVGPANAPAREPQSATAPRTESGDKADSVAVLLAELGKCYVFSQPVSTEAGTAQGPAAAVADEGPFPPIDDDDLTGPGEIRRFSPATLYEKVDGKAQFFLGYNFAQPFFTTYISGDVSIDAYVYDMNQADNAFGIYKAEEGDDAEAARVGREGYFSGSSVFFWKGKYYVNILATSTAEAKAEGDIEHEGMSSEAARPAAVKLAKAIAERLKDTGQSLWAESVLPAEGREAGRLRVPQERCLRSGLSGECLFRPVQAGRAGPDSLYHAVAGCQGGPGCVQAISGVQHEVR